MAETLRFSPLREAHIPLIQPLEQGAYPYPWSPQVMRESLRADTECLGLWQGEVLAGYCFYLSVAGELQILNLTIKPTLHGQGLGRCLLAEMMRLARDSFCTQLLLEVRRSNAAARYLYERAGFTTLGVRKGYYPHGEGREDALVMGLEII